MGQPPRKEQEVLEASDETRRDVAEPINSVPAEEMLLVSVIQNCFVCMPDEYAESAR
jgi:hypothetical protein